MTLAPPSPTDLTVLVSDRRFAKAQIGRRLAVLDELVGKDGHDTGLRFSELAPVLGHDIRTLTTDVKFLTKEGFMGRRWTLPDVGIDARLMGSTVRIREALLRSPGLRESGGEEALAALAGVRVEAVRVVGAKSNFARLELVLMPRGRRLLKLKTRSA